MTKHQKRELGDRIRNLLTGNGWTISELARQLGLSRTAVYLMLKSERTSGPVLRLLEIHESWLRMKVESGVFVDRSVSRRGEGVGS